MEKTQVMVYFRLTADDFPVEVVTNRLGIKPTKSFKKGDIIKKINNTDNLIRKYTSWELDTGYQESMDVGDQLEQILKQIRHKAITINELRKEFELECRFTIVIVINEGYTPALYFDNPVIEFANSIQADFDIDLYANPYDETEVVEL